MTADELRAEFPQLSEKVYGRPLVYLDNAATSLRPRSVVDCFGECALKRNANIHRAVHHFAGLATDSYEQARACVAEFIGAPSPQQVVFTSGVTAAINLVAFSFGEAFIREGDEILVDENSHHSNIVPWQMLAQRKGARVVPFDPFGDLETLINGRTAIVSVTHISNILGERNPIRDIIAAAHRHNVPVLVDGAQGIVHEKVDVTALDCDFYAFSGHKMYAATGTGVLYGKREYLEKMPPYMGGGEMIDRVSWQGSTYAGIPHKFEAGTQNFSGAPTFVPAIELMERMRCPEIEEEQRKITTYVLDELQSIPGLTLYGNDAENKIPLFSFTVKGAHHEDLALILDKMGIAVRSGQMCAEPLMDKCGVTGMVRASFAPYNTLSEAEYFISSLRKAIKMLE